MKAEVSRADRYQAVRDAACRWRRAQAIDDATLRAILSAYPDDRNRLSLGLRILAGLAAFVGGLAFTEFFVAIIGVGLNEAWFSLGLTVLFTAATEFQIGRLRRAQAGAEYATAILSVVFAAGAWISLITNVSVVDGAAGIAVLGALAAWRWGYALFAAVGAVCTLVACAQGPFGRVAWFGLGVAAIPLVLHMARSGRRAPAHRRCFHATGLVFLVGAYVAVNLYSLDHRWVELLNDGGGRGPGAWERAVAILSTILIPSLVIAGGLRFRDRGLIAAGAAFTAGSLVTLRRYHPIGPWWLSLVLGGTACLVLAMALRRWLDAGPSRERWGFTAEPLFADRRIAQVAQAAATLAAMSPGARVASASGFEGGGGRSGGGGATGSA